MTSVYQVYHNPLASLLLQTNFYDIALLRIEYPVMDSLTGMTLLKANKTFNDSEQVMPICLPKSKDFIDTNKEAFAVGYGAHTQTTKPLHLRCITGENGPDVFQECARNYFTPEQLEKLSKCNFKKYIEDSSQS